MPRGDPSLFEVPPAFWDRAQVVEALARRDIGVLFVLRRYTGASQPGIGMRIGGLSQPEVSRIVNGHRTVTDLAVFEQIADGLGMPDSARVALGLAPTGSFDRLATRNAATSRPAAPAAAGDRLGWDTSGALRALGSVVDSGEVERRRFLVLSGAILTAPAHEWLLARPVSDVANANGTRVLGAHVDQLDQVTDRLRRMDDDLGGGALREMVQGQARYVIGLIKGRAYTDSVGRRLYASAGELLRLSGWLAFDSGRHAEAQQSFLAALRAAHTAGDPALGANVLGFMSCQAKDMGQFNEAVTLAETARASRADSSPRVAAIVALRAAEAHANAGSMTETRRAIDAAFEVYNPDGPAPDWAYWLDEAQIHAQAGYCYQRLQDGPRAREHLSRALNLQGGAFTREGALRLALLAGTYLTRGNTDLDAACSTGARAVQLLAEHVDSARCVGHVRRLAGQLTAYRQDSQVRDFLDQAQPLLAA